MEETVAMVLMETVSVHASVCMMVETAVAVAPAVQSTCLRTVQRTYPFQLLQRSLLSREALVLQAPLTELVQLDLLEMEVLLEVRTPEHGLVGHQIILQEEEEIHHLQRLHVLEMVHLQQVQFKLISSNQTMYKQVQHRQACSHSTVLTSLFTQRLMSIISRFK